MGFMSIAFLSPHKFLLCITKDIDMVDLDCKDSGP